MKEVNLVVFEGRLVRDPEFSETKNGLPRCGFTVANNYSYKKDDEWVNNASFIKVIAWSKTAEHCGQYLKKGSRVRVTGRIDQHSFKNDEGKNISIVEVVAASVDFLPSSKRNETSEEISEKVATA